MGLVDFFFYPYYFDSIAVAGGSRYLAQAFISLLNFDLRLLKSPYETISTFWSEYNMVLNCHRERLFLLQKQSHLVSWIPIAVPFDRWFVWPPPFNYPPASLSALGLMPLFFKYVSNYFERLLRHWKAQTNP
jgi:hypothetical protein